MVDNPEGLVRPRLSRREALNRQYRRLWCESQDLLFAGDTNYHRRNVFHIDECVEIFRASKIGKMNDVVRYLCDFAAHFLSRSQVELHNFPSVALKKTDDRSVRLQGGFILGEQTGTGERCNEEREKNGIVFHAHCFAAGASDWPANYAY